MVVVGTTDKGLVRDSNQDYYYIADENTEGLYVVADGMGGHNAGEVASKMAVETIVSTFNKNNGKLCDKNAIISTIKSSIKAANEKIYLQSLSCSDYSGMGTTLTLVYIFEDNAFIGHVGDSRAYHIRDCSIEQITEDHSLVNELIKNGSITKEEGENHPQKNLITRAVGSDFEIDIDYYEIKLQQGDNLLLCSDGLTKMVNEDTILKIISTNNIEIVSDFLLRSAKESGGIDNITFIILKIN